jgi:hypothetical protein
VARIRLRAGVQRLFSPEISRRTCLPVDRGPAEEQGFGCRPKTIWGISVWTARRTLAGIEAMAMLAKGQVRAVPANDLPAQRAFVHQIFGLAA